MLHLSCMSRFVVARSRGERLPRSGPAGQTRRQNDGCRDAADTTTAAVTDWRLAECRGVVKKKTAAAAGRKDPCTLGLDGRAPLGLGPPPAHSLARGRRRNWPLHAVLSSCNYQPCDAMKCNVPSFLVSLAPTDTARQSMHGRGAGHSPFASVCYFLWPA
jgi:hypothetical protein